MSGSKTATIGSWIHSTYKNTPERVWIRTRHIEKDRIWREISEADVRKVLSTGSVHSIRPGDNDILWRGTDSQGRILELQCSMVTQNGVDTLIVKDAETVRVGTAYRPGLDDEKVKQDWLKINPDYEVVAGGKVQRRIKITKI